MRAVMVAAIVLFSAQIDALANSNSTPGQNGSPPQTQPADDGTSLADVEKNMCKDGQKLEHRDEREDQPGATKETELFYCVKDGVRNGQFLRRERLIFSNHTSAWMILGGTFEDGAPSGNWAQRLETASQESPVPLKEAVEKNLCPKGYDLVTEQDGGEGKPLVDIYKCSGSPEWSGTGIAISQETGKPIAIYQVKNELRDGFYHGYDAEGRLEADGQTKKGKEEGHWKIYVSGTLAGEGNFKNGEKVGIWKYQRDGKMVSETAAQRKAVATAAKKKADMRRAEARAKADEATAADDAKTYCKCQATVEFINSQIEHEHAVGAASGFVNKSRLYGLGQNLVGVREYLSSFSGRDPASACTVKPSVSASQDCMEEVAGFMARKLGE